MKALFPYYGGKQWAISILLDLLPKKIEKYIDPFVGGGSLYWAMPETCKAFIINDKNDRLINFYKILKDERKYKKLIRLTETTLHCESQFREAQKIINETWESENEIARAWAMWAICNLAHGGEIHRGGGFRMTLDESKKDATRMRNLKGHIKKSKEEIIKRLEKTCLYSRGAHGLIKKYNKKDSFFFLDPPYVGADQGHYSGYEENDLKELLDICESIIGKFILTHQKHPLLSQYIKKNAWKFREIKKISSVAPGKTRNRVEYFVWNYEPVHGQKKLF